MNNGLKISQPIPPPSICATVPTSRKRRPPIATLFIAIIDSVAALGSGLNCMAATQKPPRKASTRMLRCSAWKGTFARRAHW
ncbi:hypothetical protein D3C87_1533590 [compost metagenome]